MSITINKHMDKEKYIKWLINGEKEAEVRLATDEYKLADYIIFTTKDTNKQYKFKIIEKKYFNSFEDCIDYYGYNKLICDTKDKNDCLKIYQSFYPNKEYLTNQIISLKLKLIENFN